MNIHNPVSPPSSVTLRRRGVGSSKKRVPVPLSPEDESMLRLAAPPAATAVPSICDSTYKENVPFQQASNQEPEITTSSATVLTSQIDSLSDAKVPSSSSSSSYMSVQERHSLAYKITGSSRSGSSGGSVKAEDDKLYNSKAREAKQTTAGTARTRGGFSFDNADAKVAPMMPMSMSSRNIASRSAPASHIQTHHSSYGYSASATGSSSISTCANNNSSSSSSSSNGSRKNSLGSSKDVIAALHSLPKPQPPPKPPKPPRPSSLILARPPAHPPPSSPPPLSHKHNRVNITAVELITDEPSSPAAPYHNIRSNNSNSIGSLNKEKENEGDRSSSSSTSTSSSEKDDGILSQTLHSVHFLTNFIFFSIELVILLFLSIWNFLQPYRPKLLLPIFAGFVMCFFGGAFVTVIAAGEAYQMCGYESSLQSLLLLWEEGQKVCHYDSQYTTTVENWPHSTPPPPLPPPSSSSSSSSSYSSSSSSSHSSPQQSSHSSLLPISPPNTTYPESQRQQSNRDDNGQQRATAFKTPPSKTPNRRQSHVSTSVVRKKNLDKSASKKEDENENENISSNNDHKNSHNEKAGCVVSGDLEPNATAKVPVPVFTLSGIVQRPTLLFHGALHVLKAADPHTLSTAVMGLNAGFLVVLATLKMQFAKTVALGNALAVMAENHPVVRNMAVPFAESLAGPEYKKWVRPMSHYLIKMCAVSLAWGFRRVVSSFHSAMRGGQMLSRNVLLYTREMRLFGHYVSEKWDVDESFANKVLAIVLAGLGLWFQFTVGTTLPFPLNVVLFPVKILEQVLVWAITYSSGSF